MENEYRPEDDFEAMRKSLKDIFLVERECTVLYLIRHGNSDYPSRINDYDPPLSHHGWWQCDLLGKRLARHGINHIITSSTLRCRQTADYIKKYTGVEPEVLPGLEEIMATREKIDWARGFGRIAVTLQSADREGFDGNMARAVWRPVTGVESKRMMRRRSIMTINEIINRHSSQKVAIITHCFYINAYLGNLLKKPGYAFFYPDEASISVVLANQDRRAIYRLNDSSHYNEM